MKRILSAMLSMLLCLSCVSVGMTAVFADDAGEYTPIVALKPEMYSPKTVYTDDDFNNRDTTGTSLSTVAADKEQYAHPVIVTANKKTVTNYALGHDDNGGIYAQAAKNKSMMLLTENNVDADRIAVSFKFKFPTYYTGTYFLVSAATNGGTTTGSLFHIQYSTKKTYLISYYCYTSDTATSTTKTSAKTITADYSDTSYSDWCNVSFELERRLKEGSTSEYDVYISKFYFTNGEGETTDATSSMPERVNVDWWSHSVKESAIENASNVALRINGNYSTEGTKDSDLCIDDVMVYVPDDLKMKDAFYDSDAKTVKAVFTRGLNKNTLDGITIKSGENTVETTAALDPTDTSNRTVILTPTAELDVENKSYIVTASGVTDLEGNEVPAKSVIIGKPALIVENAKYYVNDAEVTTTKVEASAGQTVAAKADVTNPTDSSAEIMPIVAYYEDGVLCRAGVGTSVTVNTGASAQISASFTMPDTDGTNGEFKFFAFANDKLTPIMGAIKKGRFSNESATLFLVGDSICTNYTSTKAYPQTGWGQTIGGLLADEVTVKNYAYSGFSTKTYMDYENYSGNWAGRTWNSETMVNKNGETVAANPILSEVNAGDYVIVSLGINDSFSSVSEETYKGYLKQMAVDTKAKGAEIIFVTPTISTNTPLSADPAKVFTNTYGTRGQMMKEAAAESGAVCLDLGTEMMNYYNTITENATTNLDTIKGYHLYNDILIKSTDEGGFGLTSDDIDNHSNSTVKGGGNDGTHLSSRGADMVANLIVDLLRTSGSNLKYYIK